ncbi:hypothetical protein AMTRI_Chr01g131310 [Amborella trichopoda]
MHLFLSSYLFSMGIHGLITSRNMVRALIRQLMGVIFSIFFVAIAVAETTIVSSIYRNRKSIRINQPNLLKK